MEQSKDLIGWIKSIKKDIKNRKERILLMVSPDLGEKIDKKRGKKTRNAFIVSLIEKHIDS